MRFVDFSQYDLYLECPLKWYEKYVSKWGKAPKPGYQDTALTLGTLVHAGLESLRTRGVPEVPAEVYAGANCSPEWLAWAQVLLRGYVAAYPGEHFPDYHCEAPLQFPLVEGCNGLAKVDYYWEVHEPTRLADGLGGEFVLEPGWWIKEYKTKDVSRSVGNWMLSWRMGAQASFQALALQEKIGEPVRGIFVDTLEKPKPYSPKRTCKGCKGQFELREWVPTGDGFRCPSCENVQVLDTSDKSKKERVPSYYRLKVERSQHRLELDKLQFAEAALEMQAIEAGTKQPWRAHKRCINPMYGACEYLEVHDQDRTAEQEPGFVKLENVLGYTGVQEDE